ncbi:HD domain-containing protein [Bacillus tianshenii]|uniref:HD-GYP domain-containing protein n=1 Tax=Sutcliffiella tianshenii TaxID=1463404 RepID=UPI001CD2BA27|nr:HD domain-containing phosphohydrolase [Bacillus tianshenii]MCA1319058.1 HD domain-containing protein [Bacillus tianshenii]
MYQNIYHHFVRHLLLNYLIGSSIAVLGVGGILIFSTLDLSFIEIRVMFFILFTSAMVMGICEYIVFRKHTKIIRNILCSKYPTYIECKLAFIHTHRFPLLTVKRIIGPHFLGLSIPAITLALICIRLEWLDMPRDYVVYASIGALLIAGMHAFIEYFLTTRAIQPVLASLQDFSKEVHGQPLSLEGDVLVSIRTKFLLSALFIGIFPVLLFSLATQVRLDEMHLEDNLPDFWNWAFIILLVAAIFSSFGAFLLFRDIIQPINTLLKGMKDVKENQLVPAKELYGDEFSNVISGFNSMVHGLKERNETNRLLLESFYQTLSTALDARDPYTAGHSLRVSEFSILIGRKANLSLEQLEQLKNTALLHDIGKIGVRDDVLLKDGKLTDEEFDQIKLHPVLGANILEQVLPKEAMSKLIPGVRSHHERFDGYGYPDQLSGTDIPLFGRIIAVADAYDAMTSDRPYRNGMTTSRALSILQSGKGTQWDPEFVDCFLAIMEEREGNALIASSI